MNLQENIKNGALTLANGFNPVGSQSTAKKTPSEVAAESSYHGDTAVTVDSESDSNKELKAFLLWSSLGIAVGVVLLFIVAKKYGYIKF